MHSIPLPYLDQQVLPETARRKHILALRQEAARE